MSEVHPLPTETGVSICARHAAHGIASGAVVPPGFSFCAVCENEQLRNALSLAVETLEGMRPHTYQGHWDRIVPTINRCREAVPALEKGHGA